MSTDNDELVLRRKQVVKALVELPEFEDAFKQIKSEIADEMFNTPDKTKREELYYQAVVVDNVRGKFVKIANDIRMLKNGRI
jgi:hypothetical protein